MSTKAAERLLARMVADFHRIANQDVAERAKVNPKAFRETLVFPDGGPRWKRYKWSAKVKGFEVWFCYTSNKNVAGYYLSWTEAHKGRGGKRVGILSHETKREAIARCLWKLAEMRKPVGERKFNPNL